MSVRAMRYCFSTATEPASPTPRQPASHVLGQCEDASRIGRPRRGAARRVGRRTLTGLLLDGPQGDQPEVTRPYSTLQTSNAGRPVLSSRPLDGELAVDLGHHRHPGVKRVIWSWPGSRAGSTESPPGWGSCLQHPVPSIRRAASIMRLGFDLVTVTRAAATLAVKIELPLAPVAIS